MKIKCSCCGKPTHKTIGNHRYKESGLDNVYLENIPVYECSCGISFPSIFRLSRLNELIALTLVEKPALLSGNEIKFLRKNLRLTSKVFANKLGVGKTTLSKWENQVQNHSEGNDRLIRAIYIIEKGIKRQDQLKIQKHLENSFLKNSNAEYVIIAEKIQDDYAIRYRPGVESRSEQFSLIDALNAWKHWSIATSTTVLGFAVFAETGQTYVQQKPFLVDTDASLIPGGTELHAT